MKYGNFDNKIYYRNVLKWNDNCVDTNIIYKNLETTLDIQVAHTFRVIINNKQDIRELRI